MKRIDLLKIKAVLWAVNNLQPTVHIFYQYRQMLAHLRNSICDFERFLVKLLPAESRLVGDSCLTQLLNFYY